MHQTYQNRLLGSDHISADVKKIGDEWDYGMKFQLIYFHSHQLWLH